jgi:hypothetical protein
LTESPAARRNAFIASAIIIVVVMAGWLAMPRIMLMVSGGGPYVGMAVAIAFMLAFFAVLWLRALYQRRNNRT